MNREIKFRAFYKGKMYDVENMGFVHIKDTQPITNLTLWNDENSKMFTIDYYSSTRPLMQYTGLKDKDGVEIYEGDIIRICHYEPWDETDPEDKPEYSIHEVKWGELSWVVNPTRSEEYNDLGMVGEGWEDGHLWMEVIGNIYENSELLK